MNVITPMEVIEMIKANEQLTIIDVREVEEVAEGKIPGAINIPIGLLEFRMHELDKSKEYTLVCLSGGRSGRAAQLLKSHGYSVVNMIGGMMAWDGPTE